ncbi:MAG: hypothetical protein LBQ79_09280 [Deltaproteobacteria bacterium]|jgi:hypothetical protein|nr:hypothetical protein [Deltaproteobacteria bacterium]
MRSSGRYSSSPDAARSRPAAPAPALSLLLVLLLAGCAARGVDPDRAPSENLKAEHLAAALWADGEDLKTFAMRGDATYRSGGSSNFFRFELVCERPGSFLFTAFDPFGSPAFRIASSGGSMTAVDYGGKAFYAGSVSGGALGILVPLPLSPEELLAALSGSLPFRPSRAEAAALFPDGDGDAVLLAYPPGSGRPLRVQVSGGPPWESASAKTVRRVSLGPANAPDFQVSYGSWEAQPRDDRGGAARLFPRSLRAAWRSGGDHSLEVGYREGSRGFTSPAGVGGSVRPDGYSLNAL